MSLFKQMRDPLPLNKLGKLSLVLGSALVLAACGGDDDDDDNNNSNPTYSYEVTLKNLTHNQPLSPMGVLIHGDDFAPWAIGSAASVALEDLAEGGDNSAFIGQSGTMANQSGNGAVAPGNEDSVTLSLQVAQGTSLNLSLATMLVNTNDAFTGTNSFDLNTLSVGESYTANLNVYDAGTEANSELAGTIPGPADGGEGTNEARDDVNVVALHPGVVSQDDGYAESVLDSSHRFDGPVARVIIQRTQ